MRTYNRKLRSVSLQGFNSKSAMPKELRPHAAYILPNIGSRFVAAIDADYLDGTAKVMTPDGWKPARVEFVKESGEWQICDA